MVVLTSADSDAKGETTARHHVQRRGLLGEQGGLPQRPEQDLGLQADPRGGSGESRQRDQRLGIGIDEAVEQTEGGEGAGCRSPAIYLGVRVQGLAD